MEPGVELSSLEQEFRVSGATLRNWVKTGELELSRRGFVSRQSADKMRGRILRKERLTTRANKLSGSAALALPAEFRVDSTKSIQSLDAEYQASLSAAHRNGEGVYYTPSSVVAQIMARLPPPQQGGTFLEPACGSGVFLQAALEHGFAAAKVVGWDIDPVALRLAANRLSKANSPWPQTPVLENRDFLSASPDPDVRYELMATNPPWGKKLPSEQRARLSAELELPASTDTCALFVAKALAVLAPGGRLACVLPAAFFNVGGYECIRKLLLQHHVEYVLEHGKIFKGLQTAASTIIVRRVERSRSSYTTRCISTTGRSTTRQQLSFASNPKSIFNSWCDARAARVLEHVLLQDHITLAGQATWGMGIVTGNNKACIVDQPREGDVPVYRGAQITPNGLQKTSEYLSADLSTYQQTAPQALYQAPEKLVYRFICNELVFFCDTQARYFLNSANLLIPSPGFPLSQEQLCAYLNSKLARWMFRMLFNTHKVLRADLESLPIFSYPDTAAFDETRLLESLALKSLSDGSYAISQAPRG